MNEEIKKLNKIQIELMEIVEESVVEINKLKEEIDRIKQELNII